MSRPDRRLTLLPSFYNAGVPAANNSRSIRRTETIGVIVLALVILAVILIRWGGLIPWSAR